MERRRDVIVGQPPPPTMRAPGSSMPLRMELCPLRPWPRSPGRMAHARPSVEPPGPANVISPPLLEI